MEAKVSWQKEMSFVGVADSGFEIKLDSHSGPQSGAGPVELVAISLAGCTAMDVISILTKKQQVVTSFDVKVHAERADDYPKVITRAVLEYIVVGHHLDEAALIRAIELSMTKYCPVHAMLSKAFAIDLQYSIYEDDGEGKRRPVRQGVYQHSQ
ncbi:MAG: OsmC family protein [Chloroflexi bacterium]|nr:OsmC family protein [Chloroflexota bacterium]